jgi:hypothetical protein
MKKETKPVKLSKSYTKTEENSEKLKKYLMKKQKAAR